MNGWKVHAQLPRRPVTYLTDQLSQELLFVHAVLESLAAVDENYGDFVIELSAKLFIGVDVDLPPYEATSPGQLHNAFLHDFTQVATLAGINQDLARYVHQAGV